MKNNKHLVLLFFIPFIFVLLVMTTDPYKLPLLALLVPFILIGSVCYLVARLILQFAPISNRKRRFISVVLMMIILLGVLLQSIRQLSIKDFLILFALLVGLSFYMRRIDV